MRVDPIPLPFMSFHLSRHFQAVISAHVCASGSLELLRLFVMAVSASSTAKPLVLKMGEQPLSTRAAPYSMKHSSFGQIDNGMGRKAFTSRSYAKGRGIEVPVPVVDDREDTSTGILPEPAIQLPD